MCLSYYRIFFLFAACKPTKESKKSTNSTKSAKHTKSSLELPKEFILLKAINKPEWEDLSFMVFEITPQWNSYHRASDLGFSSELKDIAYRFSFDENVQKMLKENRPDELILKKFKEKILNVISFMQNGSDYPNFPLKTSYDQLRSSLQEADSSQLLSAMKYCLRDTRNLSYNDVTKKYEEFFHDRRRKLLPARNGKTVEEKNKILIEKFPFLPNRSINSSEYDANYNDEATKYVAIAYDKKEKLPTMSVNIYLLEKGEEKYQEHRFISKNHSYGLIKALKNERVFSGISLHLHAAALKATGNDFFAVSPLSAMADILFDADYSESGSSYGTSDKTNEKFKQFSNEAITIEESRMIFKYE